MFVILSSSLSDFTLSCWVVSFLWTRFYNNTAKSFGAEGILRRRLGKVVLDVGYKESGRPCESKSSTNVIFLKIFFFARRLRRRVQYFKHCLYGWNRCFRLFLLMEIVKWTAITIYKMAFYDLP